MSDFSKMADLFAQIKDASANIKAFNGQLGNRLDAIEANINDLYLKTSRPSAEGGGRDDATFERKSASEMCRIRHTDRVPKDDGITTKEYLPSSSKIDEALARAAVSSRFCGTAIWRNLMLWSASR